MLVELVCYVKTIIVFFLILQILLKVEFFDETT